MRWLSAPIVPERWHPELLARIGTAHLHGAPAVLDLLEEYARHAERHQRRIQELSAERSAGGQRSLRSLSAILLLSEQQGAAAAQISWARRARDELRVLDRRRQPR